MAEPIEENEKKARIMEDHANVHEPFAAGTMINTSTKEVFDLSDADPVLAAKMHLVNEAINEIGWTNYHWKLFFLNGFGYAVDSQLVLLQGIVQDQVSLEFNPSFPKGITIALYVGLLIGALFWGFTADMIGRRWAFNLSLLICSIFAIVTGAAPNFVVVCLFVAISGWGAGGNLVLDTTVFLEYLPRSKQWVLTAFAAWWGVGQTVAGLFAWVFMCLCSVSRNPDFSCPDDGSPCTKANNMGWRYLYYVNGGLVLLMSIARVLVVRLNETPKYWLGENRDDQVMEILERISKRYNRPLSLTLTDLTNCGTVTSAKASKKISFAELWVHIRGLFATRQMSISTTLTWFSWTLIGLAYPLYYVYLPQYLASRGKEFGEDSNYITWRNYALGNLVSIFGPILAGLLCEIKFLGRKGTMVIGALVTMAFFFAYTQVSNAAGNVGFNCAIGFWVNVYYGTLYAYTPEVLPAAHRATGNGIAVACNRVMGIMSAIVALYANTASTVPIYICAA
ncbi:MAG: hypothetical protein M1834_004740 [Cirrosporium novae-zelandiae]|nr:MAG: hypothetical protein M1834_004740 [Cirrosporium novae-zelandiae]